MKLSDWLQTNDVSRTEFARRIGVSKGAVTQLCKEDGAWLSRETAELIAREAARIATFTLPRDRLLICNHFFIMIALHSNFGDEFNAVRHNSQPF